MGSKKPKPDQPAPSTEPIPDETLLRVEDSRLLAALTTFAKRQRRSRNMTIQLLLEDAMKREGLWPPDA